MQEIYSEISFKELMKQLADKGITEIKSLVERDDMIIVEY